MAVGSVPDGERADHHAGQAAPHAGLAVEYLSVEQLFSGRFMFRMPWFQRAYAWTEDHAARLLNDVCQAMRERRHRYYIGRVMLSGELDGRNVRLVDGHQRAMTLTILFSLLRARLQRMQPALAERLDNLIVADAAIDGAPYRLTPQDGVADFFRDHVQSGASEGTVSIAEASDAERNIFNNLRKLESTLADCELDAKEEVRLVEYLLERCILVVEIVDNEDEAWEMLDIEEATGLAFHPAARAKITLLSVMPRDQQDEAGKIWESWQSVLGDDGMMTLIRHLRELSQRRRSTQPVENDVIRRYNLDKAGVGFMRDILAPAASRLAALQQRDVGAVASKDVCRRAIRRLDWLGHTYWQPSAMCWMEVRGEADQSTALFFRLLERKAWLLRISGADVIEHERRFLALCQQIRSGIDPESMSELKVGDGILRKARENLHSRTFFDKKYSRPVLRYLCDLLGGDAGAIDGKRITVEHVLPRNPERFSDWGDGLATKKQIGQFAHRLGNMAFLSFEDNQKVGNKNYELKRGFLTKSGFAISVDAASATTWTSEHILARSEALADLLFGNWELI